MPFPPDRMAQSLWLKATNTEPTLRRAENIDGKIARLPRSRATLMCGNPGKALQACAAERGRNSGTEVPVASHRCQRLANRPAAAPMASASKLTEQGRQADQRETEKRRNAGITPRGDQYICG